MRLFGQLESEGRPNTIAMGEIGGTHGQPGYLLSRFCNCSIPVSGPSVMKSSKEKSSGLIPAWLKGSSVSIMESLGLLVRTSPEAVRSFNSGDEGVQTEFLVSARLAKSEAPIWGWYVLTVEPLAPAVLLFIKLEPVNPSVSPGDGRRFGGMSLFAGNRPRDRKKSSV